MQNLMILARRLDLLFIVIVLEVVCSVDPEWNESTSQVNEWFDCLRRLSNVEDQKSYLVVVTFFFFSQNVSRTTFTLSLHSIPEVSIGTWSPDDDQETWGHPWTDQGSRGTMNASRWLSSTEKVRFFSSFTMTVILVFWRFWRFWTQI